MNDFRRPQQGNFMRWKGAVWVILQNRLGTLSVQEHPDGRIEKISLTRWQDACYDGSIVMVASPTEGLPESKEDLAKLSFEGLPPSMQAAVRRKKAYIEAFLDPLAFYEKWMPKLPHDQRHLPQTRSAAKVLPLLRHVKAAMDVPGKVPGFTSFNGWLKDWQQFKDWRLMAPRYDRRGPNERPVIVGKVRTVVEAAIAKIYLTTNGFSKLAVFQEVENNLRAYNKSMPGEEALSVSERQVYRYMKDTVDQYDAAVARKGKAAADARYRPVRKGPESYHVMDIVEVDHTQAKTEVYHDETLESLGRPWVTAALDRCSRLPVGLHIHFEGQTTHASMQALKNTMLPKGFLRTLLPDLTYEYPCCGNPVAFFFDRGPDFISDQMDGVGLNCDIRLDYAPGENPEYKAKIERFFRTLHEQTALTLKGAVPRIRVDGDRRPRKSEASISFSDFVERTWRFITMDYARSHHEGIGTTPLERWTERAAERMPRPPLSKAKLDEYLMLGALCSPSRQGVSFRGLIWQGEVLKKIRTHPSFKDGKMVLVRIDEADVGNAFVTDPYTGMSQALEPFLERYMPGTSMFLHDTVVRNIAKKKKGTQSEVELLATKAKLRDQALETMSGKNTGSKTRARLARLFGMGIVAPSGDDLGSLDPRGPTSKARAAAAKAPGKAPRGGQDPATVDTAARMPPPPKEKSTAKASKPLPRTTLRQLPEPEDD